MSNLHKWRLAYIIGALAALGLIVCLVLYALRQNINLFFTPTELWQQQPQAIVRIGGAVKRDTLSIDANLNVRFVMTDDQQDVVVNYQGILPDLFREGQLVVAKGRLQGQQFYAEQILSKHDENYVPPELKQPKPEVG